MKTLDNTATNCILSRVRSKAETLIDQCRNTMYIDYSDFSLAFDSVFGSYARAMIVIYFCQKECVGSSRSSFNHNAIHTLSAIFNSTNFIHWHAGGFSYY